MTGTEVETLIRDLTGVSASKLSTEKLFSYVNIVRNDVRSKIENGVNPNFWYAPFSGDTEASKNEYIIDTDLSGTGKIFKVKELEIKRSSTDNYPERVEHGRISDYNMSRGQLKEELSQSEAFWTYENNNIVIFPSPSNAVTGGIVAYGPYTFDEVDENSVEGDMFPGHNELIPYENIIALGVIPYIERHRNIKDKSDVANSENLFKEKLYEMIEELNTKYDSVVYGALPSTKHLQV